MLTLRDGELALRHRRRGVLDLQRRVGEPEAVVEQAGQLDTERVAVGALLDEHVRRKGWKAVADRPDVQVVHVGDLRDREHGVGDLARLVISSRIRVESRSSDQLDQKIRPATTRLATGSARSQPVTRMIPPAIAVPAKAARSVARCRNAPRTFRLSRLGRIKSPVATRLTATPASATTRTRPPRTSGGSTSRRIAV
jgi:hypothetical protein